jgi:Ni/Co efflux regulator RcnB
MKSKAFVSAVIALSVVSSGLAIADNANHDDRGRGNEIGNTGIQAPPPPGAGRGRDFNRGSRQWANNRYDVPRESHQWNRGERLPRQYWDRQYVVDDWRGHHLRQPPHGYHWVQSGSDYLLVAIASGVIADLLLNHR